MKSQIWKLRQKTSPPLPATPPLPAPAGSATASLQYIADSPSPEHGGFHPQAVQTAKDALVEIHRLREAVLLYHEAWNGCEGNWHEAMRTASKNADSVLWNE